jgi:hypothetical protein
MTVSLTRRRIPTTAVSARTCPLTLSGHMTQRGQFMQLKMMISSLYPQAGDAGHPCACPYRTMACR